MDGKQLSRRQAGQLIAGGSAALVLLSAGGAAGSPLGLAQPKKEKEKDKDKKKQPPAAAKKPMELVKLFTPGKKHDWTLQVSVDVNAYVQKDGNGMPVVHDFNLDSATVVFPVLKDSSCHRSYTRIVKSEMKLNDVLVADRVAKYEDKFPCGTRLGKWEMKNKKGREMSLEVNIPMTCWQTKFDEKSAELVPWPGTWPQMPMSTFNDTQTIGVKRDGTPLSLIDHRAENIKALLEKWTSGKDPKTIAPVKLAKYLAGEVLEKFQPSGDALRFLKTRGMQGFEGFNLKGAEETVNDMRGSEHDIACVLCAVYRAAGLPARLVIGFDITDEKGSDKNFLDKKNNNSVPLFRTWVEFALYEETNPREIWVPVDVNRQRRVSSKVQRDPKLWRYFGSHDEMDTVLPIAHQFHPPTAVLAHGAPCFWGWTTTPEAQTATQFLRFGSITTPRTVTSDRDREDPADEPTGSGGPRPPAPPKK